MNSYNLERATESQSLQSQDSQQTCETSHLAKNTVFGFGLTQMLHLLPMIEVDPRLPMVVWALHIHTIAHAV